MEALFSQPGVLSAVLAIGLLAHFLFRAWVTLQNRREREAEQIRIIIGDKTGEIWEAVRDLRKRDEERAETINRLWKAKDELDKSLMSIVMKNTDSRE